MIPVATPILPMRPIPRRSSCNGVVRPGAETRGSRMRLRATRLCVPQRLQLDLILLVIARRRQRVADVHSRLRHGAARSAAAGSVARVTFHEVRQRSAARSGRESPAACTTACVASPAGGGAAGEGQGRRISCQLRTTRRERRHCYTTPLPDIGAIGPFVLLHQQQPCARPAGEHTSAAVEQHTRRRHRAFRH